MERTHILGRVLLIFTNEWEAKQIGLRRKSFKKNAQIFYSKVGVVQFYND